MQIIKHHTAIELKNQFSPFYIFILSYQWYLPMWSFWLVQHGLRWIWTIPTSKNCSGCIKHEILSTIFMITPFFKQILTKVINQNQDVTYWNSSLPYTYTFFSHCLKIFLEIWEHLCSSSSVNPDQKFFWLAFECSL